MTYQTVSGTTATARPSSRARPSGSQARSSGGRENFSTANANRPGRHRDHQTTSRSCGARTRSPSAPTNEFFKFRNLFIRDNFGNLPIRQSRPARAGLAQSYDYKLLLTATRSRQRSSRCSSSGSTPATSGGRPPADRDVWPPLRTAPCSPTTHSQPCLREALAYRTDEVRAPMWSPRADSTST